jgi:signal transduction histidine kinase
MFEDPDVIIFFLIFILFIIVAYKFFRLIAKAFFIGFLSALFPIIGNYFLDLGIPINIDTMMWFAITGIILYFFYEIIKLIIKGLKILTYPFRAGGKKKKEEEQ